LKILIINTLYPPHVVGGAEISVQILVETLVKKGIKVVIATLSREKINCRNYRSIKIYNVLLRNVYWPLKNHKNEIYRIIWHAVDTYNPFMAQQIAKIIRREHPDIIHTNNLSGFSISVWDTAKKFNIPVIHTLRDYYLLCHLSTMYRNGANCLEQCLRCRLFSFPKKCLSNIPICVTGTSQYILDRHLSAGFFSNINDFHVVPNSYSDMQQKSPKSHADKLRLGYIGRISPEKGVGDLVKSLNSNRTLSYDLHIAGTGPLKYVNQLKQKSPDKVHYHGYITPADFFKMIDLLIVPSRWNEPFGRTIIEAFYYGIPVIGSKRGGIPELIDEGKTGYLYDPDKTDSLMNAIEKFSSNPMHINKMQEYCLKQSRKFDPATITEKYIEIYNEILSYNH
jgi:glycosyltransferase involved in cell wall biosynthesis